MIENTTTATTTTTTTTTQQQQQQQQQQTKKRDKRNHDTIYELFIHGHVHHEHRLITVDKGRTRNYEAFTGCSVILKTNTH